MNVPRGLCFCADMAPTQALNTCTWWHDLPRSTNKLLASRHLSPLRGTIPTALTTSPAPVQQTSLRVAPHQPSDSRASLALILPRLSATNGLGPACPWLPQVLSLLLHGSNDSSMSQCNNTSFVRSTALRIAPAPAPDQTGKTPHSDPLSHENMISTAGRILASKNPPQGIQTS